MGTNDKSLHGSMPAVVAAHEPNWWREVWETAQVELETTRRQNEILREQVSQVSLGNKKLHKALTDARLSMAMRDHEEQTAVAGLNGRIREAEAEVVDRSARIDSLEAALATAEADRALHNRALHDSEDRLARCVQRISRLETDLLRAEAFQVRAAALESDLAEARNARDQALAAIARHEEAAALTGAELAHIAARLDAVSHQQGEAESRCRDIEGTLAVREAEFAAAAEAHRAHLDATLVAHEADRSGQATALADLEAAAEALRQRLTDVAAQHQADVAEGEAALASYRAEQAVLAMRLDEAVYAISRLQTERDSLRSTVAEMQASPSWRFTQPFRTFWAAFARRAT